MYPCVHCSIYHGSYGMKTPKCPLMDDWIKTMWHIRTMEHCSAMRKDERLSSVTTWMDLESVMLSKISRWKMTRTIELNSHVDYERESIKLTEQTHGHRQQHGGYQRGRELRGE